MSSNIGRDPTALEARSVQLQDKDTTRSTSEFSADHSVSEVEAISYYHGLRGDASENDAPRLIYRTSRDVFPYYKTTSGWVRSISLFTVHEHAKLSKNNLWATIRDEAAGILDHNQIKWTSIDLVRFLWEDNPEPRGVGGPAPNTTGPPTVWIGVLPCSTNTTKAFELSKGIMQILRGHDIDDVEIAFRESVTRPFTTRPKPILLAPVNEYHSLYNVIHYVNTALSLPIVASDSPQTGGALGFYFKVGEDLYGVTARHVLIPTWEGNETYSDETSTHRKYVSLMTSQTLESCRCTAKDDLQALRKSLEKSPPAEQWKRDMIESQIDELRKFLFTLDIDWTGTQQRTIGHVVWSPPICGLDSGDGEGYTRDVCVINLDKDKFMPNMLGNAIEIGACGALMCRNVNTKAIMPLGIKEVASFVTSIHPETDHYERPPGIHDGMYHLKRILPVADITDSNVRDWRNHHTRYAVRSGPKPKTALGILNGFMSRVRHYTLFGSFDSIEMAMFSNNPVFGSFASLGDSGAAVVGSSNEFVAQLTSGTGVADFCEIAYGTPMEWLWNKVIKPQFPDAVLFFDAPLRNTL